MKKSKKLLTFAASLFALTVAVSCGGGGTSSGTPTSADTPVSEPAVSEPVSEPEVSAPEVSEPEPEVSEQEPVVSEPEVDTGLADAVAMLNEVMKDKNTVTTSSFDVPAIVDTVDYTYQVEWSLDVKADGIEGAVALGEKTNAKQTIAIKYEENFNTVDTYYDLKAVVSGEKLSENLTFEGFKVPQYKYSTVAEWIKNKDEVTPTSIQGVVTAVNKTDAASAFTITDETGTAFSYDAPSAQLNVGDEVVISSVYSDYNGFPQLKEPQVVKTIATDQLAKVASYMETVDINTINENLANYVSDPTSVSTKYLKITGGYIVLNEKSYPTLSVSADNPSYCVNLYYHSSELKSKVGAQVDVVCAVRGVGSSYITVQVQSHEIIKEAEVTETYEEPAYLEKTVAEVAALASDEIAMKQVYKVTGTWANVDKGATIAPESNTYGNGTITDAEGNSLTIYGFASTKDAATWNEVAGAYSFSNPKDFATELAYADGTEVTVGLIYSGTKYDNYYAFNLGTSSEGGEEGGDDTQQSYSAKIVSDGSKTYVAAGDTTDFATTLGVDTTIFSVTFETNNCTNSSGIARFNTSGTGIQVYGGNYQGSTAEQQNGAAIIVKVEDGQDYTITSIIVDVNDTKGYSVNGCDAVTAKGESSFDIYGKEFKVQSVTSTQTKIESITINYVAGEAENDAPVTYKEPAYQEKTISEVIALESDENSMKQVYVVTGTWANVDNKGSSIASESNTYGNGTVTDAEGNSIVIYGLSSSRTAATFDETTGVYKYTNAKDFVSELAYADGTEVTVGVIYSGTGYDNYYAFDLSAPAYQEKSIAEVIALESDENSMKQVYVVTGTWANVSKGSSIAPEENTYGNGTVTDAEGNSIVIYGLSSSESAAVYNPITGAYEYTNAKDFVSELAYADGTEVTVGVIYSGTGYDNYYAFVIEQESATPKSVAYIFNNGTVDGVDTSYVYDQKIEGSSTEWNGLTIDATSGKLAVRDTDTQMNQGTVISFDVEAGATVVVTSYPGYHNYTVNDVAVDADAYTVTFTEASTVTIVATGSAYLYSIVVTY